MCQGKNSVKLVYKAALWIRLCVFFFCFFCTNEACGQTIDRTNLKRVSKENLAHLLAASISKSIHIWPFYRQKFIDCVFWDSLYKLEIRNGFFFIADLCFWIGFGFFGWILFFHWWFVSPDELHVDLHIWDKMCFGKYIN